MERLIPYWDIRNAGASLVFLRYHLNLPEMAFRKNGVLRCTAKQLYDENFDLLFCFRAGFHINELSLAGFEDWLLKDKYVQLKDENGNWLEEVNHLRLLKNAGFQHQFYYMNFTLLSLKDSGLFTTQELKKLGEVYEFHSFLDDEYATDEDTYSEEDTTEEYNIVDEDASPINITMAMSNLLASGQLLSPAASITRANTR